MALLLPRSIFLHIPKTGGEWVREAIKAAGVPTRESNPGWDWARQKHSALAESSGREAISFAFKSKPATWWQGKGRFTFAFVRDPFAWYPSFWSYRMEHGWDPNDRVDAECKAEEFEPFAWNVLKKFPGHVSDLYELYVGRADGTIDFVGRQESLAEDLVRALRAAGEKFDEARLRATPPVNEGASLRKWKERCVYSDELRAAVAKAERRVMKRFGYF